MINVISIRGRPVKAVHNSDGLIRIIFHKGSYSKGIPGGASPDLVDNISLIMNQEEALNLINMLSSHYDAVVEKYELMYRDGHVDWVQKDQPKKRGRENG
jgi:hypothetical protein